jgi:beta-lactam-binding protein with PASTA domain
MTIAGLSLAACGFGGAIKSATNNAPPPTVAVGNATVSVVPNVVGKRLVDAQPIVVAAGLGIETQDVTGEKRAMINPKNWIVRAQSPKPGTKAALKSIIVLKIGKPSDGAGATHVTVGVIPNVVCMDLQAAQDAMQSAGFLNLGSTDGAGQGRVQILDRDWVVIGQSPAARTKPPLLTRVVLTVVKYGEPTGSSGCAS